MSLFPYPDPSKAKADVVYSMPQYQVQPSISSQRAQHTDEIHAASYSTWPTSASSGGSSYTATQNSYWQNAPEPRGLGLEVQSLNMQQHQQLYRSNDSTVTTMAMSNSWSSPFEGSVHPCSLPDTPRADSAMDCCNFSVPVTAGWEHGQNSATAYMPVYETMAISPEHSLYSGSSRPSISDASPYARSESEYLGGGSPCIKVEEPRDYASGRGHSLPSNASNERSMIVNPGDLYSPSPLPSTQRILATMNATSMEQSDSSSRISCDHSRKTDPVDEDGHPERRKRGFTTPENATCSCHTCGKQFQRSYNLSQHLQTHDADRKRSHCCTFKNCNRTFVRNTDLNRHVGSVHLKIRDFKCHLCPNSFARKDTLTRHIDDGCSKRPQVMKRASRARKALAASEARRSSQHSILSQRRSYSQDRDMGSRL